MAKKTLSPTEKLFKKARRHNWDDGYKKLYTILNDENCDKGTALMMYWLSCPQFFTQYANLEECPSYNRDNYLFVKHIEKIFKDIKKEIIIYSPTKDKRISSEEEIIKDPIPKIMYEDTKGEIPFEEIEIYS